MIKQKIHLSLLAFILLYTLAEHCFAQTTGSNGKNIKLTEIEVEKYANMVNQLKTANKLVKISYPNMSGCGGSVDGYYLSNRLVLIDSRFNAELGFYSRTYYIRDNEFIKIIYRLHAAEWGKYEEKYPSDQVKFDPAKMTYTDTTYYTILTNPTICYVEQGGKMSHTKPDEDLTDMLVDCGREMKIELHEVIKQVDSLKFVTEMPYICPGGIKDNQMSSGCGDNLYWNVVILKNNAIELLIDKLDDTTATKAFVPNYGHYHTTADIAYVALQEIIHDLPTFGLLGVKFDTAGCGYCAYWQHVNKSLTNRKKFKMNVRNWYHQNKDKLVWIKGNTFSSCDCGGEHPNGGHYKLKLN